MRGDIINTIKHSHDIQLIELSDLAIRIFRAGLEIHFDKRLSKEEEASDHSYRIALLLS